MKRIVLAAVAAMVMGWGATAQAAFIDTTADGAKYSLSWTNVGNLYTFTFTADFTSVVSAPPVGTYALVHSIASIPGSVDWTAGAISVAPGTESNWAVNQGVVTNSNGCPAAGGAGKDWCVGLVNDGTQDGPLIATGSILTWVYTMNLVSGTPDFTGADPWSYKFVTTTGAFDATKGEWVYGSYQISEKFSGTTGGGGGQGSGAPEPGSLLLLGGGLIAAAATLRRRRS